MTLDVDAVVFYVSSVGPIFSWLAGGVIVVELARWAWRLVQ